MRRILVHLNEKDDFNKINEDILSKIISEKESIEIKKISKTESFYIYAENNDVLKKITKVLTSDKYNLDIIKDTDKLKCVN